MRSQRKRRWTNITRMMGIRDTLEETTREVDGNVDSNYWKGSTVFTSN
jgi:hypothetical protein